jgi:hypothetical protein
MAVTCSLGAVIGLSPDHAVFQLGGTLEVGVQGDGLGLGGKVVVDHVFQQALIARPANGRIQGVALGLVAKVQRAIAQHQLHFAQISQLGNGQALVDDDVSHAGSGSGSIRRWPGKG